MAGRLEGKTAVIVGAGQTPGETLGNGRAMALLFAAEGAKVLCVDRIGERAEETAAMILEAGGDASALQADVSRASEVADMVAQAVLRLRRIDILVNNVGIGGGDGPAHKVEEAAFDRILVGQPQGHVAGDQGRPGGHADPEIRRDRQHLLAGGAGRRDPGGLRDLQGRA